MFRWLLYVILAVWVARLLRLVQPRAPRGRMTDFHPGPGGTHPSMPPRDGRRADFSPGDVVDGDFEEVPTRRQP